MKYPQSSRKLLVVLGINIALLSPASASQHVSASLQSPRNVQNQVELTMIPVDSEEEVFSTSSSSSNSYAVQKHKHVKGLSLSQLLRKYPETIKTSGPRQNVIALTFDDVPDPRYTPQLLDILQKYHVKATFFVVGSRAEKHPDLVKRMIREGHVIGNHSYNHPQFVKLQMNEFRTQIIRTENIIQTLAGYKPRMIRPPYGEISEQQLKWVKGQGYKLINWNVDSLDWRGLTKSQVRNNILSHAGKGAIILQHGGGGRGSNLRGTIQALPEVITIMRKRGYSFVTLPQMLDISKSK